MRHRWLWSRRTSVAETLRGCGAVLPLDARAFLPPEAGRTETRASTRKADVDTARPPYALAPAVKFSRGA